MSRPTPDAKAIVHALAALTEQVQRLADAQPPTPERYDAPTTADDGPRCVSCGSADVRYRNYREQPFCWPCANGEQQAPAADEDAQRAARRDSAHNLLARLDRGGLLSPGDSTLLRQHFDAEAREHDTVRSVAAGNKRHVQTIVPEIDRLAREGDQLRAVLEYEHKRANDAIDRETTAEQAAEEQRQRAEIAETELRVLRAGLRANGADPTQIQNLWAQIRLRNRQWRDAKRERDQAQAAIERVRALREPIAEAIADYREALCCHDLADDAMRLIRAAVDGTEQPTTEA